MTGASEAEVRTVLDTGTGATRPGLLRRLVDVPPESRFGGVAGPGGELWFVIAGAGRLESGPSRPGSGAEAPGPARPVRPGTGVWLPPGTRYLLRAGDQHPLRLDSVALPAAAGGRAATGGQGETAGARLASLADCEVEVTGDRRFRVLFGPGRGCDAATQFVGEIPPGRAPAHSHAYDEVVLVLDGEGVLHAGPASRPLAPGTCLHLPPGQPHCLENTGPVPLRVLGVFHPGGSPAAKQPG